MGYEVLMKVAKKGIMLAIFKFIIYSILSLLILSPTAILIVVITFKYSSIDNVIGTIVVIFFIINCVIMVKIIQFVAGFRKTTMFIDPALNIHTKYRGKQYSMNILNEYHRKNLKIIHYTYSQNCDIKIKDILNKKIHIRGQSDLLSQLLNIANQNNLKVIRVDDEPVDVDV